MLKNINKFFLSDKLHVFRQVRSLLNGFLWATFYGFFGKRFYIAKNIKCFGWPELTYISGELKIGEQVRLGKVTLHVSPKAKMSIGKRTSINNWSTISAHYEVIIGDDVLIAEGVSIRDFDHEFKSVDTCINLQGFVGAPISIGDNVWLGRGVAILKGVTIGHGTIVGANSVVTKSFPPYSIVAGVPAKIIKMRI